MKKNFNNKSIDLQSRKLKIRFAFLEGKLLKGTMETDSKCFYLNISKYTNIILTPNLLKIFGTKQNLSSDIS